MTRANGAEDFMRAIMGGRLDGAGEEKDHVTSLLPEAVVARLVEEAGHYERMLQGNRYDIGDLVTPRAGQAIKGVGAPHIVVELNPNAKPNFNSGDDHSSSRYASRPDMRVLCQINNDTVAPFWVESWSYEPWEG